jgi:hypothetical protein
VEHQVRHIPRIVLLARQPLLHRCITRVPRVSICKYD